MNLWFIIGFVVIILVGITFFFLNRVAYRRKAIFIRVDTDQEGLNPVAFIDGFKKYRIINQEGKTKVQVAGFREPIPYTENNINPSHIKNFGAVIVGYGDTFYFADVNVNMFDKEKREFTIGKDRNGDIIKIDKEVIAVKAQFKPIPYDQRVNYAEAVKALNKKFTPDKLYIMALGVVVIGMIVAFLIVYFTTNHMKDVLATAGDVASQIEGLKNAIAGNVIPN